MENEREKYRHTFLESPFGKEVLADLAWECHFGGVLNPENVVQVAEFNVFVLILNKLGVFESLGDVVNALGGIISKEGKENEEEGDEVGSVFRGLAGGSPGE